MLSTLLRIINKYKANPVKLIIFFTSIFIAIITVSIGVSSIKQIKILAYEKNNGIPINTRMLNINFNKAIEYDQIKVIFEEIPEYCDVKIINNYTYIDEASKYIGYPLIIQVSDKNIEDNIPVLKGSYFNDGSKKNRDVLIGFELEEFSNENGVNKEISIYGEKYNVLGLLGYKNKASNWKNRVILNLENIPKNNLEELKNGSFTIQMESDKGDIDKICEDFKNHLQEYWDSVSVNINQVSDKDESYTNMLGNNKSLFKMIIIVYLISIINVIFISTGWIKTIYNEIGIMKACGMSNLFIIYRIFIEFFVIALVATIAAIMFQYILSGILNRIDSLYFYVSLDNILMGIGVAAITTLITLIGPIDSILKMAPVKFFKN